MKATRKDRTTLDLSVYVPELIITLQYCRNGKGPHMHNVQPAVPRRQRAKVTTKVWSQLL